jgi:hypothetical protein
MTRSGWVGTSSGNGIDGRRDDMAISLGCAEVTGEGG